MLETRLIVTASTTYEIEHRCHTTRNSFIFGIDTVHFGGVNIYLIVKIFKEGLIMDIRMAIDYLGLNANYCRLTQSVPPHSIVEWSGPDPQPTESELLMLLTTQQCPQALVDLRTKRNQLLAETDYLALVDSTLSTDMRTYRQVLCVIFPPTPAILQTPLGLLNHRNSLINKHI